MGGCCCCSSKGPELNNTPACYYCPRGSEERVPLSSHHGAVSSLSTGLLVDTNLDTSIPDTYRPPPMPLPYDVASGHPQTPPIAQEICDNKTDTTPHTTNSSPGEVTVDVNTMEVSKCENLKEADCKLKTNSEVNSPKDTEVDISKSAEPLTSAVDEEDVCPICLEEYDEENPKIITKCEHHFHLACILEWMERSDTCPVCDQEMIFSPFS